MRCCGHVSGTYGPSTADLVYPPARLISAKKPLALGGRSGSANMPGCNFCTSWIAQSADSLERADDEREVSVKIAMAS